MSAKDDVEKQLRAMSVDEYVAFKKSTSQGYINARPGEPLEQQIVRDIEHILVPVRSNNPVMWSLICHRLGIRTDEERATEGVVDAAESARRANELAEAANNIAKAASEKAKSAKGWSVFAAALAVVTAALSFGAALLKYMEAWR